MRLPFRTVAEGAEASRILGPHLAQGGLVGYPTETVYGLGSAPTEQGLTALAALKGRPPRKPFLLLVSGRAMAERWGLVFSRSAHALAELCWPGPLTLVLPGGEGKLPDRLRGPEGGIAVRHTSHPAAEACIGAVGQPWTSTSANRPGGAPAPGADRLAELFPDAVASGSLIVLDGGVLGNVPPSTIVDCTGPQPRIIREGAIPLDKLRARAGSHAP